MQTEINFYQEMASEHRLQEYSKGLVPLLFNISVYVLNDNLLLQNINLLIKSFRFL